MAKKGSESIVVRRGAPASSDEDFYGDADAGVPLAAVAVIERCIIWPRAATVGPSSTASAGARGIHTIDGLHIFAPPDEITWDPTVAEEDQELRPEDMVLARGDEWRLEGAVGDWRKKRTGNRVGFLFELEKWR